MGALILTMVVVTTLGDGKGKGQSRGRGFSRVGFVTKRSSPGKDVKVRDCSSAHPSAAAPPLHSSHLVTGSLLVKLLEGKSLGVVLRMRDQIKCPLLPAVGKAEIKPWSHDWQCKA